MQTRCHRMFVCGHAQNRLWARQYWRYVPPSFPGPNFQLGRVIGFFSWNFRNFRLEGGTFTQATFLPNLKHDEILNLLKWAPSASCWKWCTERLSFFWGGHIGLQRFVHVQCHFQPLPTKLVFAYFDRGSYVTKTIWCRNMVETLSSLGVRCVDSKAFELRWCPILTKHLWVLATQQQAS